MFSQKDFVEDRYKGRDDIQKTSPRNPRRLSSLGNVSTSKKSVIDPTTFVVGGGRSRKVNGTT